MKLTGDITKSEKKFFTRLLESLPDRKLWVDYFHGAYFLLEDYTDDKGERHEMLVVDKAITSSGMVAIIAKMIALRGARK